MTDRDQTDATLLRCALRECERERDEANNALAIARRERNAWCAIAGGAKAGPAGEALTAAHRETIRGAAEYLRNMGDFRLACDLHDILTAAQVVEDRDKPQANASLQRLAPEHVKTLKTLRILHDGWTEATCAIRAALAALGEPAP